MHANKDHIGGPTRIRSRKNLQLNLVCSPPILGVISPNDSVDYVSKLRWWQILLISLGALLVIVLAIRVGRRLQGRVIGQEVHHPKGWHADDTHA